MPAEGIKCIVVQPDFRIDPVFSYERQISVKLRKGNIDKTAGNNVRNITFHGGRMLIVLARNDEKKIMAE